MIYKQISVHSQRRLLLLKKHLLVLLLTFKILWSVKGKKRKFSVWKIYSEFKEPRVSFSFKGNANIWQELLLSLCQNFYCCFWGVFTYDSAAYNHERNQTETALFVTSIIDVWLGSKQSSENIEFFKQKLRWSQSSGLLQCAALLVYV